MVDPIVVTIVLALVLGLATWWITRKNDVPEHKVSKPIYESAISAGDPSSIAQYGYNSDSEEDMLEIASSSERPITDKDFDFRVPHSAVKQMYDARNPPVKKDDSKRA